MAKQLLIKIKKDGTVLAETLGLHGQECLDYVALLEDMLEATVSDSTYTADFHASATETTTDDGLQLKADT